MFYYWTECARTRVRVCVYVCVWVGDGISTWSDDLIAGDSWSFSGAVLLIRKTIQLLCILMSQH